MLAGADLAIRLESFGLINTQLNVEQVEGVWQVFSDHLRSRDAREAADHPMPESIQALVVRFAVGVVAGLVSFLAAAYLMKVGPPLWAWFVVVLAAAAAEQPIRRRPLFRHLVTGSQAGLVATVLLAAAVAGTQVVR